MKHITWQPGDIITDEKWNNIQNNYELKFKHFNIPYDVIDQNGDSFPVLNTTNTILEDKIINGYICYFIVPGDQIVYPLSSLWYLSRIIDGIDNDNIITYYRFSNPNSGNSKWFIFDSELNKLVYSENGPSFTETTVK